MFYLGLAEREGWRLTPSSQGARKIIKLKFIIFLRALLHRTLRARIHHH